MGASTWSIQSVARIDQRLPGKRRAHGGVVCLAAGMGIECAGVIGQAEGGRIPVGGLAQGETPFGVMELPLLTVGPRVLLQRPVTEFG